jgi:hypothetical protein
MENYYLVPEKDLYKMIKDQLVLSALESGGVDNWEWYSASISDLVEDYANHYNIINDDVSISDIAIVVLRGYKLYNDTNTH